MVSSAPSAVFVIARLGPSGDAGQEKARRAGAVGGAEECAYVVQAAHVVEQNRNRQRAYVLVTGAAGGGLKRNAFHGGC